LVNTRKKIKTFLLFVDKTTIPTLMLQNINNPWGNMVHSDEIYNKISAEKK